MVRFSKPFGFFDYNKLQSLTSIEKTLGLEPLVEKIEAFFELNVLKLEF
jgi:hypothetical protein